MFKRFIRQLPIFLIDLTDNELCLVDRIWGSDTHILSYGNDRADCLFIAYRNKNLITDLNCRVLCSVTVRAHGMRKCHTAEGINFVIYSRFFSFDTQFFLVALLAFFLKLQAFLFSLFALFLTSLIAAGVIGFISLLSP